MRENKLSVMLVRLTKSEDKVYLTYLIDYSPAAVRLFIIIYVKERPPTGYHPRRPFLYRREIDHQPQQG